jgi:divalent metal cation (Fe/Co/Zn/Cd) transporter
MSSSPIELTVRPSGRRRNAARAGVRIELVTVLWMTVEAVVAIGAGVLARSILLTSFGIDSVIELVAGGTLLWRLWTEARGQTLERVERAERRAAWITGIGLAVLCVYVLATAALALATATHPSTSVVGILLAAAAVLVMPILVWRKCVIAARLDSAALRADAACSLTCAYMAAILLAGLAVTSVFRWWWADAVAALAFLIWLIPETREALEGARAGRGGCGCGEDHCAE